MKKDTKKINQTRKNRGYSFENRIVKTFNDSTGWFAKRLGGASIYLPDVMCINDIYSTVIAIEAKSTTQNYAYVPQDQIERCRDWVNMFGRYDRKMVVLAFKFGRTILSKKDNFVNRKPRIFYKVFPHKQFKPSDVRADYDGNILIKRNDEWEPLVMENFKI